MEKHKEDKRMMTRKYRQKKIIEVCKKQDETLYGTCYECPFVDDKEGYRCYFELLSPENGTLKKLISCSGRLTMNECESC